MKADLLLLIFTLTQLSAVRFNGIPSKCAGISKRLACERGRNRFGEQCSSNTRIIDMSPHVDLVLQMHNEERNAVAGGSVPGLPKAMRMGEVEWNEDLAELAELFARQCVLNSTNCCRTDVFRHPGHSANMRIYNKPGQRQQHFVEDLIDEWLDLSPFMTPDVIRSFPRQWQQNIGYYARMLVQENNRIGCAATEWSDPVNGRLLLFVCFYPKTMRVGSKLYDNGPTVTGCRSGISKNYENLCDAEEDYTISKARRIIFI